MSAPNKEVTKAMEPTGALKRINKGLYKDEKRAKVVRYTTEHGNFTSPAKVCKLEKTLIMACCTGFQVCRHFFT